ncbi:MAG: cytochrome c biogenesis protein ResB [Candidatus Sumerlaeia bacterium]
MASVRTGTVLLAILAIASMVGSVYVSAGEGASERQMSRWWYEAVIKLASGFGSFKVNPTKPLALFYYSWWYKSLILLVMISIICATVMSISRRFSRQTRGLPFRKATDFFQEGRWEKPAPDNQLRREVDCSKSPEQAAAAFRKSGFNVVTDGPFGYARKGFLGSYGSLVSHAGLILILMAGFISEWTNREGQIWMMEGQEVMEMRRVEGDQEFQALDFTLRCDDFDTALFPKTTIPSRFITHLTVIQDGEILKQGQVEVNKTLHVQGWELHQVSYVPEEDFESRFGGDMTTPARYVLRIFRDNGDGPSRENPLEIEISQGQQRYVPELGNATVLLGQGFPLRWSIDKPDEDKAIALLPPNQQDLELVIDRYEPDLRISDSGMPMSASDQPNNPALQVTLYEGEAPIRSFWIFANPELKQRMPQIVESYRFDFEGLAESDSAYQEFRISVYKDDEKLRSLVMEQYGRETVVLTEERDYGMANLPGDYTSQGWHVRPVRRVKTYVTALSLTRNPAIPIAYAGCAVLMVGLMMAFFIKRREAMYFIDESTKKLRVAVNYRNPQDDLDGATQKALKRLGNSESESV